MRKPEDHPLWPAFAKWSDYAERYKGGEIFNSRVYPLGVSCSLDWSPWWFCFLAGAAGSST